MAIKHLHFFDKMGNDVTPIIEDGLFKISLKFNNVSTSLFEVQHLFIFEEILREVTDINISNKSLYHADNKRPLDIKILNYLKGRTNSIYENLLIYFDFQSLSFNPVEEFVNKFPELFDKEYINGDLYVSATEYGLNYLDEYLIRERNVIANDDGYIVDYVKPRSNFIEDNGEISHIYFRWKEEDHNNIFTFLVDHNDPTIYYRGDKAICKDEGKTYASIVKLDNSNFDPEQNPTWRSLFLDYKFDEGTNDGFEIPPATEQFIFNEETGFYEFKLLPDVPHHQMRRKLTLKQEFNHKPLQLNFAINSEIEGEYTRTLEMFFVRRTRNQNDEGELIYVENAYKIAEIYLYGEVIGKDERFQDLLQNFGRGIEESDYYVLSDQDIDDDYPDYIKINQKFKELLLSGDEIYSYFGSYRSFFNSLKWLGYFDIRVREHFYNVLLSNPDMGLTYYSTVDLPMDFKVPEGINKSYNEYVYGNLLNNPNYNKTARFSLVYDMNRWNGEYDEYGGEIIEDALKYTSEEILVKLFGLKKVLEKYFLPHHARIIDITSEGIYFAKYKIKTWQDINPILALKLGQSPDFEAIPLRGYLERLDRILIYYRDLFDMSFDNDVTMMSLIKDFENRSLEEFLDKKILFNDPSNINEYQKRDLLELGNGHPCCINSAIKLNYYLNLETFDLYKRTNKKYEYKDCDFVVKSCEWEYIENLNQPIDNITRTLFNYNDEEQLTIGKILSFYPNYIDLKNAMMNHIFNFKCQYDSFKYTNNNKLLGMPVLIRLLPKVVTWDDLDVTWDSLNLHSPIKIEDQYIYEDVINVLYSWDGIGNYDGYNLRWHVNHSDKESYCYTKDGTVLDNREIICFLPEIGFYDVTCRLTDITNFPSVTRKENYIEVLPKDIDFIAFGRFTNTFNTWDELDITWDEVKGSWNNGNYCPLETNWDEVNASWDTFNYQRYLLQDFVRPYVKQTNVLEIQDNCKVLLEGIDVYNNILDNRDKMWRNVIVLENEEKIPTHKYLKFDSCGDGKIIVNGIHNFLNGELLNLYKRIELTGGDYFIANDSIICRTDYDKAFSIGGIIRMHFPDYYKDPELYKITELDINYINNIITIKVNNEDGSLNWTDHRNPFGNINRFYSLEARGDNYLFTINSFEHDFENGQTIVYVDDPLSYFKQIKEIEDIENYYVDAEITSGRFTFEIQSAEIINNNTLIQVKDCNDFCYITPKFKAKFAEFDYDWALRFGTSQKYFWDNLNTVTWDDLKYQTWDNLEYYGNSILGFKIRNLSRTSKLQINDSLIDLGLSSVRSDRWMVHTVNLLNNSKDPNVNKFYYSIVQNSYIQAIAIGRNYDSLVSLQGYDLTVSKDSFIRKNWNHWEEQFFEGYNNNPYWDPLNRLWVQNNKEYINYINDELVLDKFEKINGSFSFNDSFVRQKEFTIPKFTTVFIVFNLLEEFDYENIEYEWELWEETRDKLMMKSNKYYLVWNFIDIGSYTLKLKIKANNSYFIKEKRSWINVSEYI